MCYPTTCTTCGKTTWAGCGQHVDSVKKKVPAAQWCGGHDDAHGHARHDAPRQSGGFLARLFGR